MTTTLRPDEVYEPSENGTRTELRCPEQIEATLRYLGVEINPSTIEYLIVCCDDDGEVVEMWAVNNGTASKVFGRVLVTQ